MIAYTPRGFMDVLPDEARWRERITNKAQAAMAAWGYAPIETPTLEVSKVLEQGGKLHDTLFRLFDSDGSLLVLRPDVTLPIARMVASRLPAGEEPLRFRYTQPVFREEESLRGQAREFTQLGIESIRMSGPAADAEVILLMVDALKACGLKDFTIAICTVTVLHELLQAVVDAGFADADWREAVLAACHQNNAVEIDRLAALPQIDARYGAVLQLLFDLRGGSEAIKRCQVLVQDLGLDLGLELLAETYAIIEALGADKHVVVDFSVMNDFDYYTGLVFEAYAPQLGQPLGSGGRYDRMLEAYGTKAAAAGFAFSLERVMMALRKQEAYADEAQDAAQTQLLALDANDPATTFKQAAAIRAGGACAVLVNNKEGRAL